MRRPTPFGAVVRGVLASLAGTVAMDLLWYRRKQEEGDGDQSFVEFETSHGLDNWEDAPVPAKLGKRVAEGVFQQDLEPKRWAGPMANIVHWAYPALWGVVYGVLAGSARKPRLLYGVPFGAGVWTTAYAVLPPTGLYKPMWEYDKETLWKDLSAHLVFGGTTGLVYRALSLGRGRNGQR